MRIRMGTLNAWALPEPLSRDVSARMRAIGEALPSLGLDLMAFQEVWTAEARRSLERAGRAAGFSYSWTGHGQTRLGGGPGGLLVLSKLPIERASFEPFLLRGEPEQVALNGEYLSGKGFAKVRLKTPSGPLTFVDTHLHARYASHHPHKHVAQRTGQAIQIATNMAGSREPMVAAGDFNFREGEPDYRVLTGILGLRDAAAVLEARQPTTLARNPYRRSRRSRRKDFVFVRDGRAARVVPVHIQRAFDEVLELGGRPAAYSNHAGLVVDLEIEEHPPLARPRPDRAVFELASRVLAQGENQAERRQAGTRQLSGIGLGCAALAGLGTIPRPISRRRMLRMTLGGTALLALTPGLGASVLSEVLVPDEIEAFRQAARQLDELRAALPA